MKMKYPQKKLTQIARTLALLLRGETLTHRENDSQTGSYRLASPICSLIKKGWLIEKRDEQVKTPDPIGRFAKIRFYWLSEEVIGFCGTEGQDFANHILAEEDKRKAQKKAG